MGPISVATVATVALSSTTNPLRAQTWVAQVVVGPVIAGGV